MRGPTPFAPTAPSDASKRRRVYVLVHEHVLLHVQGQAHAHVYAHVEEYVHVHIHLLAHAPTRATPCAKKSDNNTGDAFGKICQSLVIDAKRRSDSHIHKAKLTLGMR